MGGPVKVVIEDGGIGELKCSSVVIGVPTVWIPVLKRTVAIGRCRENINVAIAVKITRDDRHCDTRDALRVRCDRVAVCCPKQMGSIPVFRDGHERRRKTDLEVIQRHVREDGFGLPVWVVHGDRVSIGKGIGSVAKIIDRNHAIRPDRNHFIDAVSGEVTKIKSDDGRCMGHVDLRVKANARR